ncbi:MAG: helix-turn-helix transcriptional regulator [Clostridiaceae bacterium]|nr:helix-turn-helix transcriptional regulator [Clostridiaceae bacterium]
MFKDRLKALRQDGDLTQIELSKILNISRTTISGYESADVEPGFEILNKIADYFNVSVDYLLNRTDIPTPYPKHK